MEVKYIINQQQQKYKKLKVIQYLAIQQMMITGDPDRSNMYFLLMVMMIRLIILIIHTTYSNDGTVIIETTHINI